MEQSITAITLGVRDVSVSRRFYVDGLGLRLVQEIEGEIAFVEVGHGLVLALWNVASMPSEYGDVGFGASAPPLSLGRNVATAEEVGERLSAALAAGATHIDGPAKREWGGTSACFADPDGYRWDVVHNPAFAIGPDGAVRLGP